MRELTKSRVLVWNGGQGAKTDHVRALWTLHSAVKREISVKKMRKERSKRPWTEASGVT